MKQLYVIDFSNFSYKFKSVYKYSCTNVNGVEVDTSILYGFIRALKSNIATDIVIVLDGVPYKSLSVLPEYKGQRMHDETSNSVRVPKLEVVQFLTKIGPKIGKNIKVVCSPGQETDEVIASLVHHITGNLPPRHLFLDKLNTKEIPSDRMLQYLAKDMYIKTKYIPDEYDTVIIASTDGDFIQLQRWDNVFIDKSSSGKEISSHVTSESTCGTTPLASIVYKSVYGDISDNIPSIKVPWNKDKFISDINKYITSDEDLQRFFLESTTGVISNWNLSYAAKFISKNCSKQFRTNWTVAFLVFRSYPFALEYPSYNIESTLKKYNLKV